MQLLVQAGDGAGPITSGGGGYGSAVVSGVPEQLADRKGKLCARFLGMIGGTSVGQQHTQTDHLRHRVRRGRAPLDCVT